MGKKRKRDECRVSTEETENSFNITEVIIGSDDEVKGQKQSVSPSEKKRKKKEKKRSKQQDELLQVEQDDHEKCDLKLDEKSLRKKKRSKEEDELPQIDEDVHEECEQKVEKTKEKKKKVRRIVSWNIGGMKWWLSNQFLDDIMDDRLDILALQETKCAEVPDELISRLKDYHFYLSSAEKSNDAGVLLISKRKPLNVWTDQKELQYQGSNEKGRLIIAEFKKFYFVNALTPHSGGGLVYLKERLAWNKNLRERVEKLDELKPVIIAGNMNVAHTEKDLAHVKSKKYGTPGFSEYERMDFSRLLNIGFVDVFRELNPDTDDAFTYWWNVRIRNPRNHGLNGWRLDYFVVCRRLFEDVQLCKIHSEIMGCSHCPISLKILI